MGTLARQLFRFGPFEVDPAERRLTRDGTPVPLTPKAFDILLVLVQSAGRTVEKDKLLKEVWPDTFVEEGNLAVNIFGLRKALGNGNAGKEYIETIPKRGYRFTADVLRSMDAPTDLVIEDRSPPESPVARRVIPSHFGYGIAVLSLVLLLTFLASRVPAVRARFGSHGPSISLYRPTRRSIAVLGFQNVSGRKDQKWLSAAFSEMLTTELGVSERLRVISGENIARMKSDFSLSEQDSYASASLQRIRGNLGSDMIVAGSYTVLGEESGGQIRLDLRLQDTATGETTAVLSVTGTEAKLFDLVSEAGERLRDRVGIGSVLSSEETALQASRPGSLEAERLYAEGLTRLHAYDDLAARSLLESAVQQDPKFAPAHAALSSAWSHLGYELKAREEAKQAFELSNSLPREQRLVIEARYRQTNREWDKAADVYHSLFTFFPDNIDYGIEFAYAQIYERKAKNAVATLESLRNLPMSPAYAARVDLQLGFAKMALSDLQGTLDSARKAQIGSHAIGGKVLEARAWHQEAIALRDTGRTGEAVIAFGQAKSLFAEVGNRDGVARVICDQGMVISDKGEMDRAREMFQEALGIFRALGNQTYIALSLREIGHTYWMQGDLVDAKKIYKECLEVGQASGRVPPGLTFDLASVLYEEGDLAVAKSEFQKIMAASDSAGDKFGVTASQVRLGVIAFAQGDVANAREFLNQALTVLRPMHADQDIANALVVLADVLLTQGDIATAQSRAEEALVLYQKIEDKPGTADGQAALAAVLIEEGKGPDGERLARQSSDALGVQKLVIQKALADCVLARGLLAEGKPAEAKTVAERAKKFAQNSQFLLKRIAVETTVAQVEAATGQAQQASHQLRDSLAEAKKMGAVRQEFEARLALDEVEMQMGKISTARADLARLEADATAKGFLLIAHKAAARRRRG
jgi:eukaryotic-like serine/threonine-protein kinase